MRGQSDFKASVVSVATQLVQLRQAERDSGEEPTPSHQDEDQESCSIQTQLRHIELDWPVLLADVPVIQQTLHKVSVPCFWNHPHNIVTSIRQTLDSCLLQHVSALCKISKIFHRLE